jgi:ABC-type transporter lipoprotein component MlaA
MVSGYMPVLESVMANDYYKTEFLDKADGYDNVAALSVKVGLEQKNSYYVSPAFTGSSTARDEVGNIMQNVFVNYGYYVDNAQELLDEQFANAVAICERKYPSNK